MIYNPQILKQKIIKTFNLSALKEYQVRLNFPNNDGRLKYFDAEYEFTSKCLFAIEMGLSTTKKMNVLDISCGMGYLGYIAKTLNHNVTVTDVPDPVYDEPLKKIFGFDKIIFGYPGDPWRFIPLPENIGTFDVISSLSVVPMSFWEQKDWNLFVDDCMNHLNNDGVLYIRPNGSSGLEELKRMALKNRYYKKHTAEYVIFTKK